MSSLNDPPPPPPLLLFCHLTPVLSCPPYRSAVVELLQRNWVWHNLDQSFLVQTQAMGDLHHFAWRARHRNQTAYINKRDGERFGDWTPAQCAVSKHDSPLLG